MLLRAGLIGKGKKQKSQAKHLATMYTTTYRTHSAILRNKLNLIKKIFIRDQVAQANGKINHLRCRPQTIRPVVCQEKLGDLSLKFLTKVEIKLSKCVL